jgi:hypothetical protein
MNDEKLAHEIAMIALSAYANSYPRMTDEEFSALIPKLLKKCAIVFDTLLCSEEPERKNLNLR